MRTITIVRDLEGKIRIAQFGNYRPLDYDDTRTNADIVEDMNTQFTNFIHDISKIKTLLSKLSHISFFPKGSIDAYVITLSNKKKDQEYYLKYLDDTIGVQILNNIVNFKDKEIKLTDYSAHSKDGLFSDIVYEIDFKNNLYKITMPRKAQEIIQGELVY